MSGGVPIPLVPAPATGYGAAVRTEKRHLAGLGAVVLAAAACGTETEDARSRAMTDAGVAPRWTTANNVPTQAQLLSVWGRAADDVWAVGFGGTVIHFDGVTWTEETTTATVPLTGVSGLPLPNDLGPDDPRPDPVVFAVGWQGTVLRRSPDGTWQPATLTSTFSDDLFGLSIGRDDRGLAVGDNGRIVVWDGLAWTPQPLQVPGEISGNIIEPKGTLQRVWTRNGDRFYITGSGGAAYRSSGGVMAFGAIDTRISDPLRGVWGTGDNNVYAVGLEGLILRYDGNDWRRVRNNGAEELPSVFLFGVSGKAGNDIAVVGWRGTAIRFDGTAWTVETTDSDVDLRDVWVATSTDAAFAVGAAGTVLQRDYTPVLSPIP